LKSVGGLTNEELHTAFAEWNKGELESFLIEISRDIFSVKDDKTDGDTLDVILDKTGSKGTGKWTVQQAAELAIAAPTIAASLDARYLSALKDERVAAADKFKKLGVSDVQADLKVDKKQLIDDVRKVNKRQSNYAISEANALFLETFEKAAACLVLNMLTGHP
jgi:6-phosphogluconate dehydrogenase